MTCRNTELIAGFSLVLCLSPLSGCHADTAEGGGADRGHAVASHGPTGQHAPVPAPPSADLVDPNSPQAILHGTSTTSPGRQTTPTPALPPRQSSVPQ